jgi:hemoglobin/transferrin/lactoferrin receptor protein
MKTRRDVGHSSKKRRPISNMAPASGTVGARWTEPSDRKKLWVEGSGTFTRQQHRLSPGDKLNTERIPPGGTPGWSVFTLRAGKRLSENWTVTAAVENLTDLDYRAHGSGTNEPGTNFILAVEAKY